MSHPEPPPFPPADWLDATRLAHQLRVHQIELEQQNQTLREAQLAAEAGWDHYRELYDFAPVGYFTLDRQGRILQVNLAGASLLGVDRSHLVDRLFAPFILASSKGLFGQFLRRGLDRQVPETCEVFLSPKGGKPLRVRLEGAATEEAEQLRLVAVDLTALYGAREEVRLLNEQLEQRVAQRTQELASAYADLQSFSSMASHELRAPLARMEGFSLMLRESAQGASPERLQHIAERIEASSQRMREVVDRLLYLARLSADQVRAEPVDLSQVAEEVMGILAREGSPVPARVVLRAGVKVLGDRRLLEIALHNLLGNAVKFSGRTPRADVEFGQSWQDGRRVLWVRDNGAGFDPAHAARLFQPFERLHSQEAFEGVGLGLTITRKIIQKHAGQLWAEASPGAGATFFFTLGLEHRP